MNVRIHPTADVSQGAQIGAGTSIWHQAQVRENSTIGANCVIGKGVYVDAGVMLGDNVKVQNYVSIYHGVVVEDGVFLGPHCCFTNDRRPRAVNPDGSLKADDDWVLSETRIKAGAAIGANATIVCGTVIGRWAMIGSGSVVTRDIPDHGLAFGNPARLRGFVSPTGEPLQLIVAYDDYVTIGTADESFTTSVSRGFMGASHMINIASPLIGTEEKQAVLEVLDSGMIAQGPRVKAFEEAFAAMVGVKHAVATSSGTTALHTMLLAHGIGPGDEVITSAFTFIASANSVLYTGARPIFVDIDPLTFNLDPARIEAAITPQTRAIMPVHLFGLTCDMAPIQEIAARHELIVLEDAAQSHGATYNGQQAGAMGTGAFSLYPTKNMTSGEGGMVTTDDESLAETCRVVRQHGMRRRYYHDELGFNFRMTDVHAAIGLAQLQKLSGFNERRRANAAYLDMNLEGVCVPQVPAGREHVYHQYTIRVAAGYRDALITHMRENGVGCGVYYPVPIHRQTIYLEMGYDVSLPETEQAALEVISLPVHPALTEADLATICRVVNAFTAANPGASECRRRLRQHLSS